MLEPKRIETSVLPNPIERLGNNTYYYNYDIQSKVIDVTDPETQEVAQETRYTFIQVHLHGYPDYKQCVKAIIRQYVSQEEEFDLINSANSLTLGISSNESDRQKYIDYLTLVQNIKDKVKSDYE